MVTKLQRNTNPNSKMWEKYLQKCKGISEDEHSCQTHEIQTQDLNPSLQEQDLALNATMMESRWGTMLQ